MSMKKVVLPPTGQRFAESVSCPHLGLELRCEPSSSSPAVDLSRAMVSFVGNVSTFWAHYPSGHAVVLVAGCVAA
jgi:hypothetical protein